MAALPRLLLPTMKAQVSVASVHGLRQCMECLGGVGYCENNENGGLMNIAKIYRDSLVNPIWEGTVSVIAEDVVRVLTDTRLADGDVLANAFVPWIRKSLDLCRVDFNDEVLLVEEKLQEIIALVRGAPKKELLYCGREILQHLEVITSGVVLLFDALIAPDDVVREVAVRWIRSNSHSGHGMSKPQFSEETMLMDKQIFLGISYTRTASRAKI